jgi:hypothetical protein
MKKLQRAFATCVFGLAALWSVIVQPVHAQAPSAPGSAMTVPVSESAIYPAEYNGDVRALPPPLMAPDSYYTPNEFEAPPNQKPHAQAPAAPQTPQLALAAMPAPTSNFAGMSFSTTFGGTQVGAGWPPDTNGDVGPTYYIQAVNTGYGIFSKATGALVAGFTENQLWSGAGTGTKCDTANRGDPIVLYDAQADRWILTNFAFSTAGGKPIGPFYQCFAVSKSGDPVAGGWYLYAVRMDSGATGAPPSGTLNDYGKFGLWTDCLYMGANGFTASTGSYAGAEFAAFDRTALFSGAALTSSNSSIGFISGTVAFTMVPANILGSAAASLPPAGTAEYFVSESLSLFTFEVRKFQHGATACGATSTLSAATNVSQTSYPFNGTTTDFVPQSGTTNVLDSLEDRVMQKAQYRRIGATESLWVVHTTGDGSAASPAAPQWAQIDVTGGTIATTPVQQLIYQPDTTLSRWMGSLAVDHNGNMAVGYSTSSASAFPSIAYAGRLAGDPVNTLPQTETVLVAGGGSQTNLCGSGNCQRWGDYTAMSIDPADDCTFWYTNEYYDTQTNGTNGNWQTRIGAFKFPDCGKTAQTITFTSTAPVGAKYGDPAYIVTATATSGLPVTLTIDASASTVCQLSGSSSGSQVTYIGTGTCKIDANQAGDATYAPAPQVQQSYSVAKASQTISFTSTAPVGAKFGDAPYTVTATSTSGLAVTLTIAAASSSVCSLSGSSSGSQVSYVGTGTCTINANQAGNGNYLAAPQVQQSYSVAKAPQTISFTSTAPVGAKFGDTPYTVTATSTSGLAVTLSIDSGSTSVCSLSGSSSGSQVSYIGTGTCTINANQAGNGNYLAAPQVQQSYSVAKAPQTISFTSTAPASAKFGDAPYTVTATATSGLAVTLSIDAGSTTVCSLSGSSSGSQVSYIGTGTCAINANQAGNGNYNAATQVQQSFGVGKGSQTISFTSTAPASAKLLDPAYTVTATATSGLAVTLTIDAASTTVCSLSGTSSGSQVTYLATGTCTIDANQGGNSNYNAAPQAQQSFTISKATQTISFTSIAPVGAKYGDAAYIVTATATSGLPVTLTIDATSTSVCSLSGSSSGSQVSYIGTGTCKIDANQAGDSTYAAAAQAQQSYSVGKGTQTINFTSSAPVGAKFGDTPYTVTATATSGLAVTLTIDAVSASVCSLSGSSSGSQVSYIGTGTCTIDANQSGNSNYNAATQVQQSYSVGKASQTVSFTSTAPVGAKYGDAAYTVTASASSGLAVVLSIDPGSASVCSLSGSSSGSQVTYIGTGTCTINGNQAGNGNYLAAPQAQQSYGVAKSPQSINFTSSAPAGAKYGDTPYTVTATATSGLAVVLSIDPASASVCSLSGSSSGSQVSYIGTGTCAINANQAGNGNYLAASQAQQSFAVGKGSQMISFTSTAPAGAKYGDTPYTVTATASSGLAVVLSIDPASASVCSLSGSISGSQVSYIGTGTCAINANQSGNTNYNVAPQAQQSFAVGKGNQTVSFTSTAPVGAKYGDAAYVVTATSTSGLAVTLTIDATSTSVCSLNGSSSGSQVSYIGTGTCKIDANQAGNSNYNAATQAQQSFSIGKGSQTVNFTSTAPVGAKYGDAAYTVTATATSGLAVVLSIDPASASVCSLSGSSSGSQVSYIGTGTCTIDANQSGNSNYNAATQAQQSYSVGKGSQTVNFTSTAPVGARYGDVAYTVTASASSGLAVVLSIDPASASVCSLSGSSSGSQVTYIGTGTCTIDANQAGNSNYNAAAQAQQSFSVGKASQTVGFTSPAPVGAKYGDAAYTVTATATSGLAVVLSIDPASASVCSLSGSSSGSQVTYIGTGTCTIDADQAGNSNYNGATQVQQSFGVAKAAQTVAFTSTAPIGAALGDPAYTVTALATSGLATHLSIDAPSASVCTIDGSTSGSHVSFIGAGTCTIDADQAGDSDYLAAAQTQQSFPVGPGMPTLEFTTQPSDVVAGSAPGPVTVTEKNPLDQTVDDNTSVVDFTVESCGGPVDLGTAPMVHGVATLAPTLRFYTVTGGATLTISASTGVLDATSGTFAVTANPDSLFAQGFENCRP